MVKAIVKMQSHDGINVDFEIEAANDTAILDQTKRFITSALLVGFQQLPKWQPNKTDEKKDLVGMRGMVISVKPTTTSKGTAMYAVTAKLDDGGKEVTWNEFNIGAFRINDRVEMIKNDRGFIAGQLVPDWMEGDKKDTKLPL